MQAIYWHCNGGDRMQIEIRIDETCKEPKVIIVTNQMTDEIKDLAEKLSARQATVLAGFKKDTMEVMKTETIERIYAAQGKVYAVTEQGEYMLRLRLYELEERLPGTDFVRISNSEIINLRKVKAFDLSFTGTICVTLTNGTVTYVSRRYVSKIKQVLGI